MVNKRTVYNKAIDTIVDRMVIGHENEADEYIYFHDNIPGGLTASVERTVDASHNEIVAITQYRYNMREMFKVNDINTNPKTDVFRYMHLSEVLTNENIMSQKITVRRGISSNMDVIFQASTEDQKDHHTIIRYDDDSTLECIIVNIDNIKGYCVNEYDYKKMKSIIDFIRPKAKLETISVCVDAVYNITYTNSGSEKSISTQYTLTLTKDTIETDMTMTFYCAFLGLKMNKDKVHSVSNTLSISSKSNDVIHRNINLKISSLYTVNAARCGDNGDIIAFDELSSESQTKSCMLTDKSYGMNGLLAICKEADKMTPMNINNAANLYAENYSNGVDNDIRGLISKSLKPLYIIPIKKISDGKDEEDVVKKFDPDCKSNFIFIITN